MENMDFMLRAGDPIQTVIDKTHVKGGGRVVLEPGVHPSGTI